MVVERKCIDCNEPLHGRSDQKFCSDACRNHFNNRLKNKNNFVRNINNLLLKNRRILSELNKTKKATVHRDHLLEKGFVFSYFTSIRKTRKGKIYYYCYEQGYLPVKNDLITLIRIKENEEESEEP